MNHVARVSVILALLWSAAPTAAGESEGTLSVDRAFEQLKTYEYGQNRRPLAMLELEIARSTADPQQGRKMADRLAAILTDPKATLAAKRFACQQLAFVGSEAQVPALVRMLAAPETADMARRTLERIPGEASAEALRAALARLTGPTLVGLVNSLGVRRDAKAADALVKLLGGRDLDVAAAAAAALGKIGTADAARALEKAESNTKLLPSVRHARLRCAERLAAAGDVAAAESIYRRLWESDAAGPWRLAALTGLAKTCPDKAAPLLVEAIGAGDPVLQGAAANMLRHIPGKGVTKALADQLGKLDDQAKVLLIDALAARADPSAGDAVAAQIDVRAEVVRAAAVAAMATLGDASDAERLARLAAAEEGAVQQAARTSLARMADAGVDERLLALAAEGDSAVRAEVIGAIAARRTTGATPVLLTAAADADERVRLAALSALAVTGEADAYRKLIGLLVAASTPSDAAAAEKAVLAVGGRLVSPAERLHPVLAAMKTTPSKAKPSLLRVLAGCGGAEALAAVRPHLEDADSNLRDAAVRVLSDWPDASAAADLLNVAKDSDSATHRSLALRGYLRLARAAKNKAARLKMLKRIRPIAKTADARKMLLAALADVADPGALDVAESFLDDPDVKAEAALAVRKIKNALKPKRRGGAGAAPVPRRDKQRGDALKKELSKRAPKEYRLACYLDCGPDTADGVKGGPILRLVGGKAHFWAGSDGGADSRFGTIAFHEQEVVFEATGLDPKRAYQVGFTWWDYDHDTRAQSVWAAGKAGQFVTLLDKTRLPAGRARNEKPAEKTLPIPRSLTAGGTLRIAFRNEAGPNVVVSELWLWESDAQSPPPAAPHERPQPNSSPPMPQVKASAKTAKATTRVLIVTGVDHPGHKWRETSPVLKEAIEQDPRLAVDVVEDPNFLASAKLHDYDVLVQHWMNWKVPAPGADARENFRKFVRGGKGLVLVHFACGAFQDWPEFRTIAGRAWDPKLRGHDPRGPFHVDITKVKHPITEGMKSFETHDELYTCLAGDAPVEVLATARSKVDKKVYPMAFVLTCGKGRVFHCLLGHDVKALKTPAVGELYRRGCAWAAGLAPVP